MLALRWCSVLSLAAAACVCLSSASARAEGAAPCAPVRTDGPAPYASRWIAALPFGAGQFQNGDVPLGIFFAVGEAALAGTSIVTTVMFGQLASTNPNATAAGSRVAIPALNSRLEALATVNRIAFAGWAALTAAGLLEAQVSFGRRRAGERSSPPPLAATAASVPGGGMLGLAARF